MTSFFNQHWYDGSALVVDSVPPINTGFWIGSGDWRAVTQVQNGSWYAVATGGETVRYQNSQTGWVADTTIVSPNPIVDMVSIGENLLVFADNGDVPEEIANPNDYVFYIGIPGSMNIGSMPIFSVVCAAYGSGKLMVLGKKDAGDFVYTSYDGGSSWSEPQQLSILLDSYARIRHFNGKFYIVGEADYILVSSDGFIWDEYPLPAEFMGGAHWADIRVADTYVMVISDNSENVLILNSDLSVRKQEYAFGAGDVMPTSIALGYQDKTVVALNTWPDVLFFTSETAKGVFLDRGLNMTSDMWANSAVSLDGKISVLLGKTGSLGMFNFDTNIPTPEEDTSTNPFTVLSTDSIVGNRQWESATDFDGKWYIISHNGYVVSLGKTHKNIVEVCHTGLTYCSSIIGAWDKLFIIQSTLQQPGFVTHMLNPVSLQTTEINLPYARSPNPTPTNSNPNWSKVLFSQAYGDNKLMFVARDTYDNQSVYYVGICDLIDNLLTPSSWAIVELNQTTMKLPEMGNDFGFSMKMKFFSGVFYILTSKGMVLKSYDGVNWTTIEFPVSSSSYVDISVTDTHICVLTTTSVHRVDIEGTDFDIDWHSGYFRNYNEELKVLISHDNSVIVGSMPQNSEPYPLPSERTPLLLANQNTNYKYALPTYLHPELTQNPWPYWKNSYVSGPNGLLVGQDIIGKVDFVKTAWKEMVVTPKLNIVYAGIDAVAAVKVNTTWYTFGNSFDKTVLSLEAGQTNWNSLIDLSGAITGEITNAFYINNQFHVLSNSAGVSSMYSMDTDFTNVTVKTIPNHIAIGYDGFGVFFMICKDVDANYFPVAYSTRFSSDMGVTWSTPNDITSKIPLVGETNLADLLPAQTKIIYAGNKFYLTTDVGITLSEPGDSSYDFNHFSAGFYPSGRPIVGDRKLHSLMTAASSYDIYNLSQCLWDYDPVTLQPIPNMNSSWSTAVSISNLSVAIRNSLDNSDVPVDGIYDKTLPMMFTNNCVNFWPISHSGEVLYTLPEWTNTFKSNNDAIVVSTNGYIGRLDFSALIGE